MPELCNCRLVESLAEALETTAFISLTPPEQPLSPPVDPVLVQVVFRGQRRGRVELVAPLALGRLLVENTAAADPSDADAAPNPADALVELLNITCGMLLKRSSPGVRFDVAVPQALPFDADSQWRSFVGEGACDVVLAEGLVVAIRLIEE